MIKGYPELLRESVSFIKDLQYIRQPSYDLPADSFLEEVVSKIIISVCFYLKDQNDPRLNDLLNQAAGIILKNNKVS